MFGTALIDTLLRDLEAVNEAEAVVLPPALTLKLSELGDQETTGVLVFACADAAINNPATATVIKPSRRIALSPS
jgi:hypothetical protein